MSFSLIQFSPTLRLGDTNIIKNGTTIVSDGAKPQPIEVYTTDHLGFVLAMKRFYNHRVRDTALENALTYPLFQYYCMTQLWRRIVAIQSNYPDLWGHDLVQLKNAQPRILPMDIFLYISDLGDFIGDGKIFHLIYPFNKDIFAKPLRGLGGSFSDLEGKDGIRKHTHILSPFVVATALAYQAVNITDYKVINEWHPFQRGEQLTEFFLGWTPIPPIRSEFGKALTELGWNLERSDCEFLVPQLNYCERTLDLIEPLIRQATNDPYLLDSHQYDNLGASPQVCTQYIWDIEILTAKRKIDHFPVTSALESAEHLPAGELPRIHQIARRWSHSLKFVPTSENRTGFLWLTIHYPYGSPVIDEWFRWNTHYNLADYFDSDDPFYNHTAALDELEKTHHPEEKSLNYDYLTAPLTSTVVRTGTWGHVQVQAAANQLRSTFGNPKPGNQHQSTTPIPTNWRQLPPRH